MSTSDTRVCLTSVSPWVPHRTEPHITECTWKSAGWRDGDGLGPSLTGFWTPLAVLRLPSGRGLGWDNTTTPDRHTGRRRFGPVTTIFQGGDVGSKKENGG